MNVVNDAALELIKSYEGFVPNWYPDPAHGWKVPTCCYGHTDAAGEPKFADTKTKKFTKAEGTEILRRDLGKYADAVRKAVKVPLNDNQFGALVSWCYNVGPGNVAKSTLVKKLNAGDYNAVPSELAKWNKAGGKVLPGLTKRRAAEGKLFGMIPNKVVMTPPKTVIVGTEDKVVEVNIEQPEPAKPSAKSKIALAIGGLIVTVLTYFGEKIASLFG